MHHVPLFHRPYTNILNSISQADVKQSSFGISAFSLLPSILTFSFRKVGQPIKLKYWRKTKRLHDLHWMRANASELEFVHRIVKMHSSASKDIGPSILSWEMVKCRKVEYNHYFFKASLPICLFSWSSEDTGFFTFPWFRIWILSWG